MVKTGQVKLNQKVCRKASVRKQAKNKPAKFRKSLTPGTILISLTGQFRGKHVVLLKTLPKTGLLVVTGPYKLNGVPVRRMHPRHVIATSTKVEFKCPAVDRIEDSFFAKEQVAKKKGEEA